MQTKLLPFLLACSLLFSAILPAALLAQEEAPDAPPPLYLPLVVGPVARGMRVGVNVTTGDVTRFPDTGAGWYVDYRVRAQPPRFPGMEYVQMVRLHQNLTCPIGTNPDRTACPYVEPHSYSFWPDAPTIQAAARANPGSLWLIGNEMDRRDWWGSHQDEMLPELYAVAYHEMRSLIREADPTARVAIGGVVQPTPLRLLYLDRVWDAYIRTYGEEMPVDVWNIHAFLLQEQRGAWGADIPAGIDAEQGLYVGENWRHVDLLSFAWQIRSFRRWMQLRGQQDKPLIISEYGVLYHNSMFGQDDEDPQPVLDFLTATFDYLRTAKNCDLGLPADDCRLVQRWNWFSLDHASDFNRHHYLVEPESRTLTVTGETFREYVERYRAELE